MATRIQDIEQRLWRAADKLRANSRLSSQEYYVFVLGLIFIKYAGMSPYGHFVTHRRTSKRMTVIV